MLTLILGLIVVEMDISTEAKWTFLFVGLFVEGIIAYVISKSISN
jgi:hypothetical protein